jgi:hypothetical protein
MKYLGALSKQKMSGYLKAKFQWNIAVGNDIFANEPKKYFSFKYTWLEKFGT